MNYKSRIDKIEKAISEIRKVRGGTRIVFQNSDESSSDALKRAGLEHSDDVMTIFLIKWCNTPQPGSALYCEATARDKKPEKSLVEIDSKIRELQSQLKEDIET